LWALLYVAGGLLVLVLARELASMRIRNLSLRDAVVDFAFERHSQTVSVDILRRHGDVEVLAIK